jgi:hypothetical protein
MYETLLAASLAADELHSAENRTFYVVTDHERFYVVDSLLGEESRVWVYTSRFMGKGI